MLNPVEQTEFDPVNEICARLCPNEILGVSVLFTGWKVNYSPPTESSPPLLLDNTIRSQIISDYKDCILFVDSTGSSGVAKKCSILPKGPRDRLTVDTPVEVIIGRTREMLDEFVALLSTSR